MADPRHVLFLCTGNSARSILAECLLERLGKGRFIAHSAGSQPKPAPNPAALELLRAEGHDVSGLRSKSWDEFAAPGAPEMSLVVTVCDDARGELCPVWPGAPFHAHWGVPDPADVEAPPEAVERAFRRAYRQLERRIRRFTELPYESLEAGVLQARLDAIGAAEDAAIPGEA